MPAYDKIVFIRMENIVFLFYDASGKVVAARDSFNYFFDTLTVFDKVSIPYDLTYSSVKAFVYGYKNTDD